MVQNIETIYILSSEHSKIHSDYIRIYLNELICAPGAYSIYGNSECVDKVTKDLAKKVKLTKISLLPI